MKKQTKQILLLCLAIVGAVGLIIGGGILERGYYWPAAEVFVAPGIVIGYITWWIDRKEKE